MERNNRACVLFTIKFVFSSYIKKGFLLDSNINEAKKVIEYAIDKSNKEILKDEEFTLISEIAEVPFGNEYQAYMSVCNLLQVCQYETSNEKIKILIEILVFI